MPATSGPQQPIALCLSGGGYRAALFHLGGIVRLHELGLFERVGHVSSVSGGSIVAGVMSMHWTDDGPDIETLQRAVFDLTSKTIDIPAVLGAWLHWRSVSSNLARLYDKHVFHGRSLQDVPDFPEFVFNTTNMHTGDAMEWSKAAAHDYSIGRIVAPDISLSKVVAASSAFPPVLSPARFRAPGPFVDATTGQPVADAPTELWLTDGGVYDNLGLQPVEHCPLVLVSDGGAPFAPGARLGRNWLNVTLRTMDLLQEQIHRRRRYEELYAPGADPTTRLMWWLYGDPKGSHPDGLQIPRERLLALAATPTRLKAMSLDLRRQLANLGYALADHCVRPVLFPHLDPPRQFPYPGELGHG